MYDFKTKIILIVLLTLLAVLLISQIYSQSSSLGPHGGIVKPAGRYNIEMKNDYINFSAYLLDKNNKPVSNKGISCEVKFIFTDETSLSASLNPLGDDGFYLESGVPNFQIVILYFNVFGKTVTTSFINEKQIATKK